MASHPSHSPVRLCARRTRILSQIERGDPAAAEQLLSLVYAELWRLATAKLAQERPGQTLQATALVHEAAYAEILRMIKEEEPSKPSTRLSESGERLASISANRHGSREKVAASDALRARPGVSRDLGGSQGLHRNSFPTVFMK